VEIFLAQAVGKTKHSTSHCANPTINRPLYYRNGLKQSRDGLHDFVVLSTVAGRAQHPDILCHIAAAE
jgi:hypothetical protein